MLNNSNKLFFPKIKYEYSTKISQNNNEDKLVSIYHLDWQRKELKCDLDSSPLDYIDNKIKDLRFAIDDGYLKEIQRTSWASIAEWNQIRYIDKSLKDIYYLPASAYVESAFKLLVDCLYDRETEFYYRKSNKIVIPYMFLYKFWKNQISKNQLIEFSRIPDLIAISMNENLSEEQQVEINGLLKFIDIDTGD